MFKFIKRIGKYWWVFIPMFLLVLVNVFMDFLIPNELGKIIDILNNGADIGKILLESMWMLIFAILSGACSIFNGRLSSKVSSYICNKSRYELFKKVSAFSNAELNKYSISSLLTRTTNDITLVANTFSLFFRYIVYGPVVSVMALVFLLMFAINTGTWTIFYIVLAIIGVLAIFTITMICVALPLNNKLQKHIDRAGVIARENLDGLRVVRASNAEEYQQDKFASNNEELRKKERKSNKILGLLSPGIQLIVGLLNIGMYFVATYYVKDKVMEYSQLAVIVQYAALILVGFIMMTAVFMQLPRTIVCARRVNEVIEQEISIVGKKETPERKERGTIEFKHVSFSYPGAEKPVLEDISFKVEKGQTIAFIGATGAGKTTLINLMPRLYDCTSGEVFIDGVNVKDYNTEDLNKVFGYVPQKGFLFHDSLKNNICLGKPEATAIDIERALNISQSSEFVSKLPGQLDYEISQGGKNVSGGQRQRLCIARAIIMEPEIFIFDDSFSALDYKTDKVLRGEIKKQCAGVTNVIVGQRVGTIMGADKIVVLDNGKMVGIGTHRELLDNCAVYKEIALSQLSKEELENGK